MLQKRFGQNEDKDTCDQRSENSAAMTEATRSANESSAPHKLEEKKDEHLSLFWRVFGGTILSMVALGFLTLYNNISANIAELRNELNREREARADLVKKDEFNTRTSTQYERIRSLEGLKAEFEGMKERANTNAAAIETLKRDATANVEAVRKEVTATTDAVKKDSATLDVLKERVVALEAIRKDLASLDTVREKLTTALADVKTTRDDVQKIQQEQERNKASDLERKASRDAQHKQTEELLKELQRGLQDCREKLARLEAIQPRGGMLPADSGTPPPRNAEKKN